jgi:hypothetical protein
MSKPNRASPSLFQEKHHGQQAPNHCRSRLTGDLLNALKKAGPNERGNYSLDMAVWVNDKRTSDRAPGFTGSVKVKGDKDGPKGYASVWQNESSESGTDLF